MKLAKINPNMSIEMHFDGQTACLILVQLPPTPHPHPLDKMAVISQTMNEKFSI